MRNQLVNIIKSEFKIWSYYSHINRELATRNIKNMPFLRWPDHSPCIEGNLFMLSLFGDGLSMQIKGGTLRTYAYNISHLIRFCYKNRINITDLTDNWFTLFISGLQVNKDGLGIRIRSNNQILKIGRACIKFLLFIGDFHSLKNFIGKDNYNSILLKEIRIVVGRDRKNNPIIKYYWHHEAFPNPDTKKKRHPIADIAVVGIKSSIRSNKDSKLVKRNSVLLQSYFQTGARRSEVLWLKVKDVMDASKLLDQGIQFPTLRLITLKRQDLVPERFVPVPRTLIVNLIDYIGTTRKRIIKNCGIKIDHDFVFVSHTSGQPLDPDTLSTYMIMWAKQAGITEPAFLHLIRHLFITETLIRLIIQHELNNKDEFRKTLVNNENFKLQLQEWTGHTRLSSLDIYIDLAFADLAGKTKTLNNVAAGASIEVVKDNIDIIISKCIKNTMTKAEALSFKKIVEAFSLDIGYPISSDVDSC
ncbi:tyrosine-type recombinase/integrase [Methylobacter sp.]|uniref:tyrosine-type recombinase/integrase n=1 Tax=Methylobacter sp. TaxID=2051955 RepID=UPI002487C880|nr:tyrosine-type recombinase/integrase [Methylobacter sp.]MDI1276146.1 tyrosine-type recombinase/integrase [Methylobacter sp.]MDI1356965.1 tyrosine-type recombinase/integrase [Methylobacter sp.]